MNEVGAGRLREASSHIGQLAQRGEVRAKRRDILAVPSCLRSSQVRGDDVVRDSER